MIKNNRLVIGAVLAVAYFLLSLAVDLDLFEAFAEVMEKVEEYELDEVFVAGLIFLGFYLTDLKNKHQQSQLDSEKLKIYRAMLSSTQHILNNYLNQMQLFKMRAEATKDFPEETLELYEDLLQETKEKIHSLSTVTSIDEESIRKSVSP